VSLRMESPPLRQPCRRERHPVEVNEAATAVLIGDETEENRVHLPTYGLKTVHGVMVQRRRVSHTAGVLWCAVRSARYGG
jgi:hypothetical protein